MIVTNWTQGAEDSVRKIHREEKFPFPNLQNPLYFSRKIVISQGKVIGAGFVRLTGEGILILDKKEPLVTRAFAAKTIVEELKLDVKSKGLDECHVFVQDVNVQNFLKRLGFQECQGGKPLVIHF